MCRNSRDLKTPTSIGVATRPFTNSRKTLGVIGYGPSRRVIAALGAALGMRVIVSTAHPDAEPGSPIEFADFDEAIKAADYLSLHSRVTGRTPVIDVVNGATPKGLVSVLWPQPLLRS